MRRIVSNQEYSSFFEYKEYGNNKSITLTNDFRGGYGKEQPFVVLLPNTYNLLIQKKDNLLAKYTIFMKYNCGKGKGQADFTANQFLTTFHSHKDKPYSTLSNKTKATLAKYNSILEEAKIISIYRTPFDEGTRRNIYTFLDV